MATITQDGIRIHYEDSGGGGPAVLFLHAFPLRGAMWDPQVRALGEGNRFLVPDLMGFGASDAPDDPRAYSTARYAAHALAVLDDAGVEDVVVAGLSMGGYVAFEIWRAAPERVRALVLADTRADPDTPETAARRTKQQERLRAEGAAFLVEFVEGILGEATRAKKPDVVATVRDLAHGDPRGFIGALEALKNRADSTGLLPTISVPTLIVVGEDDPVTPPAIARTMHEHTGGSRLVVVPEAGHISNLESPAVFTGALAEFLTEL